MSVSPFTAAVNIATRKLPPRPEWRAGRGQPGGVLPVIHQIQGTGISTLAEVAEALNACGIAKAPGGRWHAMTVRNMVMRGAGA